MACVHSGLAIPEAGPSNNPGVDQPLSRLRLSIVYLTLHLVLWLLCTKVTDSGVHTPRWVPAGIFAMLCLN